MLTMKIKQLIKLLYFEFKSCYKMFYKPKCDITGYTTFLIDLA